jgi:hypothetical protein
MIKVKRFFVKSPLSFGSLKNAGTGPSSSHGLPDTSHNGTPPSSASDRSPQRPASGIVVHYHGHALSCNSFHPYAAHIPLYYQVARIVEICPFYDDALDLQD